MPLRSNPSPPHLAAMRRFPFLRDAHARNRCMRCTTYHPAHCTTQNDYGRAGESPGACFRRSSRSSARQGSMSPRTSPTWRPHGTHAHQGPQRQGRSLWMSQPGAQNARPMKPLRSSVRHLSPSTAPEQTTADVGPPKLHIAASPSFSATPSPGPYCTH